MGLPIAGTNKEAPTQHDSNPRPRPRRQEWKWSVTWPCEGAILQLKRKELDQYESTWVGLKIYLAEKSKLQVMFTMTQFM